MTADATAQDIGNYLYMRQHWTLRQAEPTQYEQVFGPYPLVSFRSATVDELATALFEDAEFRSLQLADWLSSPDGELIAEGVKLVFPEWAPQFGLWVDAMQAAAKMQRTEGRSRAGLLAAGATLGVGVLIAIGRSE